MLSGFKGEYVFLFPGVGMKNYKFMGMLPGFETDGLDEACRKTRDSCGMDVRDFMAGKDENYTDKELAEQISIYTLNCHLFREYQKKGFKPGILAGYSMGIYSVLYCSGAVGYQEGIDLVYAAYSLMKDFSGINEKWGMAVIVGLDYNFVRNLIDQLNLQESAFIINENNELSIVVSGTDEGIEVLCRKAGEEGALNISRLNVSIPYHTRFITEAAEKFREYFRRIRFNGPEIPILSAITQNIIETADDVRNDIFLNLKTGMSWKKTIEKAGTLGFRKFMEIGLSDSLCKLSAFINPDFEFRNSRNVFREVN